ncbi:SETMR methyltransferase, partial [Pseudoatta argentina]
KMSIQSPAKCEIRSVIRYLVWKGKTPVEVYNEVKTAYGDTGMNRTSVFKWCREFKNGRTSVHDDQRSKRPSILTDDIVEKIENALRDDRRLTMDELSAMFPQISRSLLHETITETLGYRKLSARWVPKQLTDQHKLNRVEAGQEFLRRYKLHGDEFLRSIVTGDDYHKKNIESDREIQKLIYSTIVSEHQLEHGYELDWENISVLDSEPCFQKRLMSKMIFIKKQTKAINIQNDTDCPKHTFLNIASSI